LGNNTENFIIYHAMFAHVKIMTTAVILPSITISIYIFISISKVEAPTNLLY